MADVLTSKQRSYCMSRIKSKNTKQEVRLRNYLRLNGIPGLQTNSKLFGIPDLIFPKKKVVIFVDGCFWHRCPACFVKPKTRPQFWSKKITANVNRDKTVNSKLKSEGWKILRFWEHQLKQNLPKAGLKIQMLLERVR